MPVDDAYTTFQCPECGSEFRVFGLGVCPNCERLEQARADTYEMREEKNNAEDDAVDLAEEIERLEERTHEMGRQLDEYRELTTELQAEIDTLRRHLR